MTVFEIGQRVIATSDGLSNIRRGTITRIERMSHGSIYLVLHDQSHGQPNNPLWYPAYFLRPISALEQLAEIAE